jgi:hypothetical protein
MYASHIKEEAFLPAALSLGRGQNGLYSLQMRTNHNTEKLANQRYLNHFKSLSLIFMQNSDIYHLTRYSKYALIVVKAQSMLTLCSSH